ncbi:hypothetical protein PRZ48_000001 [Zasmidium cellare]|uniref:DNA2/NAM7 helicase helicase domain-containing protein n=1 Tax=Zasmidium cellare TaxID=395010 RepID=A0ABR0EYV2_ZASCE|nr:hypothetical protein PRZ48_000001 [Zasmidium cellare]
MGQLQNQFSHLQVDQKSLQWVKEKAKLEPADQLEHYSRLRLVVKKGERALHVLGQRGGDFTFGSAQAQARHVLIHAQEVQMIDRCDAWAKICLPGRSLGGTPDPRDDWSFARFEEYDRVTLKPFNDFILNQKELDRPPWLRKGDPDGTAQCRPVYTNTKKGLAHFESVSSYARHFKPAVLYDRDDRGRQRGVFSNTDIVYAAAFRRIHPDFDKISVRISSPKLPAGVTRIVPTAESEVYVLLCGVSNADEKDTFFVATVCEVTEEGFHFTANGYTPDAFEEKDLQLEDDVERDVHVLWSEEDPTSMRRLETLERVDWENSLLRQRKIIGVHQGRTRGLLSMEDVVVDNETSLYSPAMDAEFELPSDDHKVRDAVARLKTTRLNTEQGMFFNKAMEGVLGNILLLEGFPESGKTFVVAAFICALMKLGKSVIVASQSNKGVEAVVDTVVELRQHCEGEEEELARHLRSELPDPMGRFEGKDYWMSARISRFCRENENSQEFGGLVAEWYDHLKAREERHQPTSERSWSQMKNAMRLQIFKNSLLVAGTSFVLTTLKTTMSPAQVVIIDEAGMATEADVLMVLSGQMGAIELMVLAGDKQPLGPVVPSDTTHQNPLGGLLAISPLQRFIDNWPQLEVVSLVQNYRGPFDTFQMASHLFYDDRMVAGGDPRRFDTPLARRISAFLQSADLRRAVTRNTVQDLANRQFFFNVDSKS